MFEPLHFGGLLPEYLAYWEAGNTHAVVTSNHKRRAHCLRATAWVEGQAIVALFQFLKGHNSSETSLCK